MLVNLTYVGAMVLAVAVVVAKMSSDDGVAVARVVV